MPTSEECENSRNAGLEEAELPRTEFRPLLQETHILGSKSIPVEDEDRGLGDSLPNTTSSSQTSLSAIPVNMTLPVSANCEREAESWARVSKRSHTKHCESHLCFHCCIFRILCTVLYFLPHSVL